MCTRDGSAIVLGALDHLAKPRGAIHLGRMCM